ncbi:MAG TPA: ABC transporter ATP-binding protein [Gemmataceae bacterium]|jgi:ATP-binding cassette subfamily B protein/subfamily B ATP-binding cassette protein MsbA|nr:ABC transporter ATP-binding protein [Gemmataceae bacterium]
MKNFLRALRHALPYRRRLILSIVCALCAAVLWGANFTSVYPVLKLLHTGQSPQKWIDERIASNDKDIQELQTIVDELNKRDKGLKEQGPDGNIEKRKRDLAKDLSKYEARLESARSWQARNHVLKKYIDLLLPDDCFQALVWLILAVFVALAVKCFFEFAQESLVGSVVNLSLYDLRNRFYRNIIHLDVDQFGEHGTSELMARFTNDMESLGTGIKTLFGKVVAEPLRALACVVAACFISWQLTLMFLVLVPIAGFILGKVSRLMKQATRRLLERMSSIYKILQESFQGIRVVKAFTMEPYERRRFRMATRDYYHKSMKVVKIDALADPIIELLGVAAVAGALLVGSYLVLKHQTELFGIPLVSRRLEPESMLGLYLCLAAIADPVRKLSSVFTRLQSGAAAADRIFAFLDRQPRVRRNSDGAHLGRPAAGAAGPPNYIEFRDVCFSYEPEKAILTNINLSVRQGETLALVGPNGCGKTTLVGLVPRFYDPYHGSVLIDGHDIRTLHLRSLRQQIGVVTQEAILFDDTVYNNIAYGTRGATAEQVEAAARQAFAHDFIAKFPRGYQTRVGEMGRSLSGGERQRLCLARVILRDPSVLILDEFTSAYDAESEALIHRALRDFMAGRTTFLITHRLNRLEIADRIVVLENGRIASVGTHAELLATCPPYQRLHEAHNQRLCA